MRTLILVNTLQSVSSFVYSNHMAFATHTIRKFPDDKFFFFTPHRMTIDNARNESAKMAMGMECDYLMFLDDDVLIPHDAFETLVAAQQDILAGFVYLRGYPFNKMIFREVKPETEQFQLTYYNDLPFVEPCTEGHTKIEPGCIACLTAKLVEIVPCDAVGFSCCLIKVDVIQALEPPYFVTGPLNTEDVYFCLKTRGLDPQPTIAVHTGVRCGHMLNPEPIEYGTERIHKTFYEELIKLQSPAKQDPNPRNLDYILRNIKSLGE